MRDMEKYKPAVTKTFLLLLAGIVWECVGILLLFLAFSWLSQTSHVDVYLYSGAGILLALLIHHFGFLKIVDRNLQRILLMDGKRCLFSFIPWKSYLVIAVMVAMGALLRHSTIPKKVLAILYIAIGLALILSSVRYIRVFYTEISGKKVG
jgi:Zn-dependent protease